eukprot:m.175020 g.175020  ORF g.175020 m.175020 type:complete len:99 (+) comp13510_c0_seq34:2-298(+)
MSSRMPFPNSKRFVSTQELWLQRYYVTNVSIVKENQILPPLASNSPCLFHFIRNSAHPRIYPSRKARWDVFSRHMNWKASRQKAATRWAAVMESVVPV